MLLLRLYNVGEIAFIKLAIDASGVPNVARPNRAMNDLNSYSSPRFEISSARSESWKVFADSIRASPSWSSEWFATARRFFLSGGAKRFNPTRDDINRIVDYATALESALVPEKDYNTRRITRRAAALIAGDDAEEKKVVARLVTRFYKIRSTIVHGSKLSDKQREWLIKNNEHVELRVRQVLVAAVQKVPAEEVERRTVLAALYDPADEDRGEFALQTFHQIKTVAIRKAIATKIARLAGL